MRRLTILLLFLACAVVTSAQTTTVTGTVNDPNSNPYANGSAAAQIQLATGQSPVGLVLTITVPTDATGHFSMSSATALSTNQSYVFTVCAAPTLVGQPGVPPPPKQVCFISPPILISGASQDISAQLNAVAPSLGPGLPAQRNLFGAGAPVNPCVNGFNYTNTTTGAFYTCQNGVWTAVTLLSGVGAPVNPCTLGTAYTDTATGNYYSCNGGTWLFVGPTSVNASPSCSTDVFTATPVYTFTANDQCHIMTLTGNVTSITINGTPANHTQLFLKFPEDGTGGRTFQAAFPGNVIFPTNFTPNVAANNQNNMGWTFDGTNWRPTVDFGGGSGGGGTPSGANGAVQTQNGGHFGNSGNLFDLGTILKVNEDAQSNGPNPVGVDIRTKNARVCDTRFTPCIPGITATISLATPTQVTISSASTFQLNDGVVIIGAGPASLSSAPTGLTATQSIMIAGTGAALSTNSSGYTTPSALGASTRCYYIVGRSKKGARSPRSNEACITNALATEGTTVVNNSALARVGQTVTVTTSSAHAFLVGCSVTNCGEVFITGTADASYIGNHVVTSAVDSTHYTFVDQPSTTLGASASTTGGTSTFYPTVHLSWTKLTNAWQYLVYEGASSGTETLINVSEPTDNKTVVTFDDMGSTMFSGVVAQLPADYPNTPQTVASGENLSSTITGGAGTTTLTIANAATTAVTGVGIRFTNGPAILAAATQISNAGGVNHAGPLYIPADNSGNPFNCYVVNDFQDLHTLAFTMQQNGPLCVNETLELPSGSGTVFAWKGGNQWGGGSVGSTNNTPHPSVTVGTANPGIYFWSGEGLDVENLNFQGNSACTNGVNLVLSDGGFRPRFLNNNFFTCSGATDYMSVGLHLRGEQASLDFPSDYVLDGNTFGGGTSGGDGTSGTPLFMCSLCGVGYWKDMYIIHRGMMVTTPNNGYGRVSIRGTIHINGGQTPFIQAYTPGTQLLIDLGNPLEVVMDTIAQPCVASLGAFPVQVTGVCSPSSGVSEITGQAIVSNNTLMSQSPNTNVFSSGTVPGGGVDSLWLYNQHLGENSSFFANLGGTPTPTCTVTGVGTLSAGTYFFKVSPNWQDGLEGNISAASTGCTVNGSQAITINWTVPTGGVQTMNVFVSSDGIAFNIPNTLAGDPYAPGTTSASWTTNQAFNVRTTGFTPRSGPSIVNATEGAFPTVVLAGDVSLTSTFGTPYTVNLPNVQPVGTNTFLSCTSANPAVCSWTGGGAPPWNTILNPTGVLTLAMGTNTSTFNFTSALPSAFVWANTTAATVTTSQSSPQLVDCGQAWVGSTNTDCWTFQHIIGNGLNAAITDTYGHTGSSTGVVTSQMPGPVAAGPPPASCPGCSGGVYIPSGNQTPITPGSVGLMGPATLTTAYNAYLPTAAPTANGTFLSCAAANQSVCTWTQGGFGVGSGASPVMGYYVSPNCPAFDPDGFCFNTPANTQIVTTCSWTNASTTVTCTGSPFAAGDVGKQVNGWNGCQTDEPITQYGGNIASGTTVFTIATFTDANHVILSGTPANSSANGAGGPSCFVWGNPDDTAMAAVATTVAATKTFCPKVFLAAGQYMITKPGVFQTSQPPGCSTLPNLQLTGGSYGNLDLPAGFEIEGRGPGATMVHVMNNFPNGASKVTINGTAAWFSIPALGAWEGFQMSGDGQAGTCAGITGGDKLIYMAVAKMKDITLTNFCSIPGNTTSNFYLTEGVFSDLLGQFNMVNLSAWGGIGMEIGPSAGAIGSNTNAIQLAIENTGTESLLLSNPDNFRYTFACFACYITGSSTFNLSQTANNIGVINMGTNTLMRLWNTQIVNCPVSACNTQAGAPVLINSSSSGTIMYLNNVMEAVQNAGTNTNPIGLLCQSGHTCTVFARDTTFTGGSGSSKITMTNTGDKFIDEGGNTVGIPTLAAGVFPLTADGHSFTGSCTGVVTASSTLGLYNTDWNPTNTTTTCTSTTVGAGVVATQARTLSELIVSATAGGVNASSGVVTILVNGVASTITCTIGTGTSCNDAAHAVSLNPGDRVAVQFTTQAADTLAGVKAFFWWQ